VVIERLWGVDHGNDNRVYINDTQIGQIEGHHNRKTWTSPATWNLKAGQKHIIRIASHIGGGDPDDFVFQGVIVRTSSRVNLKTEGPPKILLRPTDDYWSSTYDTGEAIETGDPCANLTENLTWNYGVRGKLKGKNAKPFTISAPKDKGELSNAITTIEPGQFYAFYFKVSRVRRGGKYGKAIEIWNRKEKSSGWVFEFENGKKILRRAFVRLNGKYSYDDDDLPTDWYISGDWNLLRLYYCRDGSLRLRANDTMMTTRITNNQGPLSIFARAYGMNVIFDGDRKTG